MREKPAIAILLLLGTIIAPVVVAGCGSGAPSSRTSSSTSAAQSLAFSKCMRAHGVPEFPDPGTVSGPEDTIGGIGIPTTINMQAPAFRGAWSSCEHLVPALSPQGKPAITASLKTSLIDQAQCMRTHGVPAYPDPEFPATGGIAIQQSPGVNPQAPAYKHAAAVCGNH